MKTIAYVALHYGADYLGSAIRSVIDHVDELHILYTAQGSHGHRSPVQCPEGRDQLQAIARAAADWKLHWHEDTWLSEGQQRDSIHQIVPDADIVLVLDSDEIWGTGLAENAIKWCTDGGVRRWRIPMVHYWRSFNRAITYDPAYPIRVIVPKYEDGDRTLTDSRIASPRSWSEWPANGYWINHMGYAQRPQIVEYKLTTHGHRGEFRKDVNWFRDVFMTNRQHDCHPIGSEFWNPETVDPLNYMPSWMADHEYYSRGVIGDVIERA